MKTKKPYWNYTPEQAVLIKLGDPDALETFIKENKNKILYLISEYFNKIPKELYDIEDYFQAICMRIPSFGFEGNGKYISLDIKRNLTFIRDYKADYYFTTESIYRDSESGEYLLTDYLGYTTSFVDSCSKIFLDLQEIQAVKIYDFCSKFLKAERQKEVLLLILEGYSFSNISLKLDLKANVLGTCLKLLRANLFKHYDEIKEFLYSECGFSLDRYDKSYQETKKEIEEYSARRVAQTLKSYHKDIEKSRQRRAANDKRYREKKKALSNVS